MRLIKFVSAVDLEEKSVDHVDAESVFGAKITSNDEQKAFTYVQRKNFLLRYISPKKVALEVNQPKNTISAKTICENFYKKAFDRVGWETINRFGVKLIWIWPVEKTMSEMVSAVRKAFYKDNSITNKSTDVAVDFSFNDGDRKAHYILGPMEKKQLAEMFLPPTPFDSRLLPDRFFFLLHDYYQENDQLKYTKDLMSSFLDEAVDVSQKLAEESFSLI